jgi:hypothetical protein
MTILARFAALFPRRSASDFRAQDHSFPQASAATSGPVLHTGTTPNADGLALLQARRLALLVQAERLRNLRRSKRASTCEAELRAVTHEILKQGCIQ